VKFIFNIEILALAVSNSFYSKFLKTPTKSFWIDFNLAKSWANQTRKLKNYFRNTVMSLIYNLIHPNKGWALISWLQPNIIIVWERYLSRKRNILATFSVKYWTFERKDILTNRIFSISLKVWRALNFKRSFWTKFVSSSQSRCGDI
jgi:hypothetical protein